MASQVVALGRYSGCFLNHKAALRQGITHRAGHCPGGDAATAFAAAGYGLEGMEIPDARIFLRAEAIKVNRISLKRLLAQHGFGIAYAQGQQHMAALKHQPVKAWQQAP